MGDVFRDKTGGTRCSGTSMDLSGRVGVVAVGIWLPYDTGLSWERVGYGATELVSVVAWGAWSAWSAGRLWNGRSAEPAIREGRA
jgi:hypothetical protein